jgi:hypothetical protein
MHSSTSTLLRAIVVPLVLGMIIDVIHPGLHAAGDYLIDIEGTLELEGAGVKMPRPEGDLAGSSKQYWVWFRYHKKGQLGPSSLDKGTPVIDGKFQISGLRSDLVYSVIVVRRLESSEFVGGYHDSAVPIRLPSSGPIEIQVFRSDSRSEQFIPKEKFELELVFNAGEGPVIPPVAFIFQGESVFLQSLS